MVREIKTEKEFLDIIHSDEGDNLTDCPLCGRTYLVDWTDEEKEQMLKWSSRKLLIQDALPNRTADEREIMRYAWSGLPTIGCCKECIKAYWGEADD